MHISQEVAAEAMPARIAPMLALPAQMPLPEAPFGYEIKWDGIRAIYYAERGQVQITSRNALDITPRYPELHPLAKQIARRRLVLDGEIVAFAADGRPSFERLQARMGLSEASRIARVARQVPATFIIFDLIHLDGRSLVDLPYTERRRLLEGLELEGPHWRTPSYTEDGRAMRAASQTLRLEGIVAKRLDSPYLPGKRSRCWLKIKNQRRQELVIAGWLPGGGHREGRIGALLVGYYDRRPEAAREAGKKQRLVYAGRVGTGFSEAILEDLRRRLRPLEVKQSPFDEGAPPPGAVFVKPALVGEFEFTEWTKSHSLRHPSFKGLREDKAAAEVIREEEEE